MNSTTEVAESGEEREERRKEKKKGRRRDSRTVEGEVKEEGAENGRESKRKEDNDIACIFFSSSVNWDSWYSLSECDKIVACSIVQYCPVL